MKSQTALLVIYTGGTIGMVKDTASGALYPIDLECLYHHIPVLGSMNYSIDFIAFDPLVDSSDMQPSFWIKLAGIIKANYEKYDGFVVLHGSDTMAYTASALSFLLENLNKTVVLTGSQIPLGVIRSDGRDNFINSIEIAAAKTDGIAMVPEVCVYFENRLYRGNRTTKFNAENFDAFISGNYPPLAEVGVQIKYNKGYIRKPNFKQLVAHNSLDGNVAILKLFPGISRDYVTSLLGIPSLRAVILETYGAGNAPTEKWFLESLKQAINKGLVIFNVTQCKSGAVEHGLYETSASLERIGVISGYDITTESAIAKLMYLIGEGFNLKKIRELLHLSLRGEMSMPAN